MRTPFLILAVVSSFLFVSCDGHIAGNKQVVQMSSEELSRNLKKGKTTQAEVISLLGEPNDRMTNSDGDQLWGYSGTRLGEALVMKDRALLLSFSKGGVLKDYLMAESSR